MRYDGGQDKIVIDVKEFVSIARRGVSPTLSYDEDEPRICDVGKRRLKAYLGECEPRALSLSFADGEYTFELSGVADSAGGGYIVVARDIESSPSKPRREELSEVRGEAFILGYMMAVCDGLDALDIRIFLFNEASGEADERRERVSKKQLEAFFKKCLTEVRVFAEPEIDRVSIRLPSMKTLKFPYSEIREGQSEFVRTAYKSLSRGGILYASAPTGTGKTVSALYPAVRALGDERVCKAFYLTPKTTTAEAAEDCLMLMESRGAKIRALRLTAKDKCCTEGRICKTSRTACKNSKNNRISEAALEVYRLNKCVVNYVDIRDVAKKYTVCPYELSLTYAELCDVIICDFNYLFDPSVYIKRFFSEKGKYAFLIDEAHNLHERAREMFSAEISCRELAAPDTEPLLGEFSEVKKSAKKAESVFLDIFFPYVKEELREKKGGGKEGAANITELPPKLYALFDKLIDKCEDEILKNIKAADEEKEQRLAFLYSYRGALKKFAETMARFDSGYKAFIFYDDGEIKVKLFCLDTGSVIRERLALGHGAVLFSATLSPIGYYRAVLGGERNDETLEVDSPFVREQLSVAVVDTVSTRFSERDDTISAVCRVIAATVSAKRGNYMVFSPSFAYSEALARAFSAKYPKLRVLSQTKNMTAKEKEEFLEEFKKDDASYLIAFCVMGGIYSEGIDLAGDSLIGAVIVGIGIPALSYEREAIAEYYEEKFEEGKQFAYIYPGMNRVFQAAGRVIRREDDRGVIVLIDDRFDDPIYKKSLPSLLKGVKFIGDPKVLKETFEEFWKG